MSAELVLAVVPICLAAMAGCVKTYEKIKLMCNYNNEVKTLHLKFEIQMHKFYMEVRLLLGEMLGKVLAHRMIQDPNHKLWVDFESRLSGHLVDSMMHQDYIKAMDKINSSIKLIQKQLDHCAPGEDKPSALQKAKGVICVGFRKEAYIEEITQLKEWIGVLRRTRKDAKQLRAEETVPVPNKKHIPAKSAVSNASPASSMLQAKPNDSNRFKVARTVSRKFQTLLGTNFTCDNQNHTYHQARLFLLPRLPGPYASSLAWMLEHGREDEFSCQSSRLPFLVSWEPGIPTPVMSPGSIPEQEMPPSKAMKTSSEAGTSHVGVKGTDYISSVALEPRRRKPPSHDLSARPEEENGESFCTLLTKCSVNSRVKGPLTRQHTSNDQAGYPQRFRFEAGNPIISQLGSLVTHQQVLLTNLLSRPVCEVVSLRHRIELALTVVTAAMMHYSTSVWPNILTCIADRVGIFVKPGADVDLSETFHTLHLTAEIGQQNVQSSGTHDVDMEYGPDASRDERPIKDHLRLHYGVQNPILFSLGVALLQIGLWCPLELQGAEAIATIRRKAECLEGVGSGYRRAMLKLLYCDFGHGYNLDNERLRQAICDTVIADLDSALRCEEYF